MRKRNDQALADVRAELALERLREEADIEQAARTPAPHPAPPVVGRLGMVRQRSRARAALNLSAMAASAVGMLWLAEGLLRFLGVH